MPAPRSTRACTRAAFGTAVLTAALAAALTGCDPLGCDPLGGVDPARSSAPRTATLLEEGTTEVEIGAGETVQVSLGIGTQGVGDMWGVVSQTDEDVADAEVVLGAEVAGQPARNPLSPGPPGSSSPFAVELTGKEPGTTTVRVLYCTRTAIAEGCDQSQGTLEAPVDPVEITVTVR
ncbi:hypothetical protein [Brachybacterium huguangmaarense]